MWTPTGVITDLGTLPGDVNSEADGINNAGQVVGVDRTADGSSIVHGWTWSAGGGMQALDPPGGWMLDGFTGIDDSGRVAGTAMDAATGRAFAFIYGAGRWTPLGTLAGDTDSFASAINSVGQVVGSSGDSSGSRAFLWSPTTGMVDLNAVVAGLSGDRLTFASSISPNGNITADTAFAKGSANHAYLLSVAAAPPVTITVPADISVPASSPTGAVVTFSVSAAGGAGVLTVACAPASGSTFPIGTTTVICSATDAFGHSASASFGVMVAGAPQQMAALQASFAALSPKLGTSLTDKLQTAQTDLGTGAVTDACGVLSALIHEMQAQSGKQLSAADAAQFVAIVQRIIAVLGCT
jgi:probable HAF family extracellular repeat protein